MMNGIGLALSLTGGAMSTDQLQPHYAERFRCIGPECEESCCQGWGMYVDKATYKKYRATPSLRQATAEHIQINPDARNNFQYARIQFPASNRCPFLADDNLCSIQKEHGSEFLSETCTRYPRALARFDGKMQRALYLSCPEAARIVLLNPQLLPADRPRYQQFTPAESSRTTSSERDLLQLRAFALDLLQDETYPLWQRMFVLGVICRRTHELTAAQQTAQVSSLLAQYATMLKQGSLRPHLDNIPARPGLQLDLVLQLIRLRFELERPHDGFACCVADLLQSIGYSPTAPLPEVAQRYHQAYLQWYEPFAQRLPHFLQNYLINYLFRTGFPFVLVPDQPEHSADPLTSYPLLVLHYRFLQSLLIGAAARYRNSFSDAHAIRVVHVFARAVEHDPRFFAVLLQFARSAELQESDGIAVLLRN
jgi:lysine-N-methylase